MRLRHSIILFAVLAAASLPRMARAQDYEYCSNYVCESDVEYDPSSSELNGYARTVDYGDFGETALKADATLTDCNGNTVAYDTDTEFGEADAYVWWAAGSSYGQYSIRGDHYYIIEDDYLEGGDFLESTYWSVDVSGPPANITNVTWTSTDSSWQAGLSYNFTVTGTGFGSSPILNIIGPDDTNYYNASCTGTACDTAISGLVQIPSSAPGGYALVMVTPVGFTGLGFGQNPPSPPPVTWEVGVVGQQTSYAQPSGEVSNFVVFLYDHHPSSMPGSALFDGGEFSMTLLGHGPNGAMAPGENYANISVIERVTGFQDGCYLAISGSAFPELVLHGVPSAKWPVGSDGQGNYGYGDDFVAAKAGWAEYYSIFILQMAGENGAYTCSTSALQEMTVYGSTGGPYFSGYSGVTASISGPSAYREVSDRPE